MSEPLNALFCEYSRVSCLDELSESGDLRWRFVRSSCWFGKKTQSALKFMRIAGLALPLRRHTRQLNAMAKLSRDQLLARVAQLEAQLEEKGIKPSTEKLVIPPRAPPTLAHSPYNVTKKPGPGPLPDILARAPKRHVAFLFSCTPFHTLPALLDHHHTIVTMY